jgi:hypothetical protein
MILVRLIWHIKNIRNALGAQDTASGMCRTIATIFVESYALYAVTFVLYIGTIGTSSASQYFFSKIIIQTQVRSISISPTPDIGT